jgi:hypothetical protein
MATEPEPEPELAAELVYQLTELEIEIGVLIAMLDHEVGRKWMSLPLRLQIECLELLLGVNGTAAGGG